jgi:hypothetical protein
MKVLHAYIDESYSDNGFYYVGALLVDQEASSHIRNGLDSLALQVGDDHGLPMDAEFHGYNMFHYQEAWACLKGKHRVAVGVYNAALKVINDAGGELFFHGLDTVRQVQRYGRYAYPPHVVALQFALERIHEHARRRGEQVRVTADRVPDQMAHEARIARYQQVGTMGYRRSFLDSIEMPFQWEDSRLHRNLQAVDMATFLFRRWDSHQETNKFQQESMQKLWNTMRRSTRHYNTWRP